MLIARICLLFLIFLSYSIFGDNKKAQTLFQNIQSNGWLKEKIALGARLGEQGKSAEPYILRLLDAASYWDRQAGIEATRKFNSDVLSRRLLTLYLEDHMTDAMSKEVISESIDHYSAYILERWESSRVESERTKLVFLIGQANDEKSRVLIKEIVSDKKSKHRITAFQTLVDRKNPSDDSFIRGKFEDRDLRFLVMKHIFERGNQNDKLLLSSVLRDPKKNLPEIITALASVKKWGAYEEQETEYTTVLQDDSFSEDAKIYAITSFKDYRSESIRMSLCELSRDGIDQETRIVSAEALIPYSDIRNLDCLKRISKELYIERQKQNGFADLFATFVTLGLSNLMKGIQENRTRTNFSMKQAEVQRHFEFLQLKSKAKNHND